MTGEVTIISIFTIIFILFTISSLKLQAVITERYAIIVHPVA